MKKCRHPHVVKLIEVIDDKLKNKIFLSEHTLLTLFVVPSHVIFRRLPTQAPPQFLFLPIRSPLWENLELTPLPKQSWSISVVERFVGKTTTVTPRCAWPKRGEYSGMSLWGWNTVSEKKTSRHPRFRCTHAHPL